MIERGDCHVPLRLSATDARRLNGGFATFTGFAVRLDFFVGRGRAAFESQIHHEPQPLGNAVPAVRAFEAILPLVDLRLVARIVAPFLDRSPGDAEPAGEIVPGADEAGG